ncbi:MAG TPA: acyl-CoA synthetase [Candidatus Sulfotelmatobacter sp.]|nr:acyl-CoA synthetase [Candidatus Sulfotelmatobacter sp.]
MLVRRDTYDELRRSFAWDIPARFNIAEAICDRHAGAGREALVFQRADGQADRYSFDRLQDGSRRLANALAAHGIARGDRVGILLPQCPETLIAHLALYRLGAVALPLFTLFGPEALEYRLNDSGAKALVTNDAGVEKLAAIRSAVSGLGFIVNVETERAADIFGFDDLVARASPVRATADTGAEDPAIIVYTSGTTGQPKGVLYPHRVLLGHMPGVEFPHDFFPQPGDRMWTPADWAWAGGLLDVLLPSLYHGVPVLACRLAKFDPEIAFDLMARHQVRNAFMPPTALKMMRQVPNPATKYGYRMRSIASGGERLGEEMLSWGRETFGLTINEFYGQTEVNLVVGNCAVLMPTRESSMGRAIPGHDVEVVDEEGRPLPPGETGTIAIRAPDPVMFLGYWNNPAATRDKFRGEWCLTGDTGHRDADGYFWFHARNDDVIISGGYRIGPAEIEDCLLRHPAVALVAAVGVPDRVRGEVVKAFIIPKPGVEPTAALAAEIQAFVKTRLSAHEYPREIEFRDSLPMTITGKLRRKDLRQEAQDKGAAKGCA